MCVTDEKDVCLNGMEREKSWDFFFLHFLNYGADCIHSTPFPGQLCLAKCNIHPCDEEYLSDGEGHPACCWMHVYKNLPTVSIILLPREFRGDGEFRTGVW